MTICDHCQQRTFTWTSGNDADVGECSNCGWLYVEPKGLWGDDFDLNEDEADRGPDGFHNAY